MLRLELKVAFTGHCLCQKTIVVTTLDVTALQDADRVIGILMKEGMEEISFIVNRMQPRLIEKGICITLEEAKSWLAVDF